MYEDDKCPVCGNADETWRDGDGKLFCESCGYDEDEGED